VANRASAKAAPVVPAGTQMLIDNVRIEDRFVPVFKSLIGHVAVVDRVENIPMDIAPGLVYVTRDGILASDTGELLYHSASDNADSLLAVRHRIAEIDRRLGDTKNKLAKLRNKLAEADQKIAASIAQLTEATLIVDQAKQAVALKKGELEMVAREAEESARRLETVSWELEELSKQGAAGVAQREAMGQQIRDVQKERADISEHLHEMTQQLKDEENKNTALQSALTEKRIQFSEISQTLQHLQHRLESSSARISDLTAVITGRTSGVNSYKKSIGDLETQIKDASGHIADMEDAVVHNKAFAARLQEQLTQQERAVDEHEKRLSAKRAMLEDIRATRSEKEVDLTRKRMQQQNLVDRVTSEYKTTLEDVLSSRDPEWEGPPPSLDSIETTVEELRMKLEAIGPVNLVAIEEYQELEERFAFMTEQEQDLINSKQQLLDMIKTINRTTSEMFKTTFDQVNINFQEVYTKLFNGGTAKLVLVDDEDVLECGIEIIARPPGKRLQNVSLLSGGERTMTAVALLFAIYMIKPSPFCMLDELDAALDESNIGRFVAVLKSFVNQSQFVIITHNRKTIAAADGLYGVTMPNKGISNIVSMKFRDFEASKAMASAVAAG
ncbi:MAG: hypothetical protein O3C57_05250, partial [Verrucomicrobia bacterium]|nr:hypothetical protein [Verrucomicrobiota bacterium]